MGSRTALFVTAFLGLLLVANGAQGTFDKVKQAVGLEQPSTADRIKDAASDVYDSAGKLTNKHARSPSTYNKVKDAVGLDTPSTADQVQDAASDAYAEASKIGSKHGKPLADYASDTADSVSQASAERYQALKDQISRLGQPAQRSYFEKAKDYLTGQKTTTEKVQDSASDTYDAAAQASSDAYHTAGKYADKAKKHAHSNGKAASGQAKRAYDATAQAGSDAYDAAADTASDAYDAAAASVGAGQKNAKQTYDKAAKQAKRSGNDASNKANEAYNQASGKADKASRQASGQASSAYNTAKDQASDTYNQAAGQAGRFRDAAGEYADKGRQAAGDAYDSSADSAASSMSDLKAALASYTEWLTGVKDEVKASTSKSAKDASAWGRDSSASTKKYSEGTYNKAKKSLSDQLGGARKTSDSLLDRTQHNSKELWASLSEQWEAATPSNKKSLAQEWGLASKSNTDFGGWLTSTRKTLSDAYTDAESSAESAWAALKKNAGKAKESVKSSTEL